MLEHLREPVALEDDRHRLLGAHDRDRDDRHAGAHRDLDEAAAPEAAQLVALAVLLAGPLGALGEHEHELFFVVQQPVRVVGVRGDAAAARPQRADDRHRPEQVLGQAVDGAAELRLDAVHDRRRVGRDRARVVGDEQRAAGFGQELEALPLDAEPVLVDRVVQPAGQLRGCARCGPSGRRRSGVLRRSPSSTSRRASGTSSRPIARVDIGEIEVGMGRGRDLDARDRGRRVTGQAYVARRARDQP